MTLDLVPCSAEQLKTLIENADGFAQTYGLQVIDGYLPFAGALQYSLNQMQAGHIWHPWLPYLFIFRPDQAVVGMGGFKSTPEAERQVEIGYSIAPSYQNRGLATSAARQLIKLAFETTLVDCVYAHTLAEPNASTRVLQKCGMIKVSQAEDPEVGQVWRWEIYKSSTELRHAR